VLRSRGLRISLVGSAVFLAGILGLLVLPTAVAVAPMLIGGLIVWAGFIWTLMAFYMNSGASSDSDEAPDRY
jgi:hypothetical protein